MRHSRGSKGFTLVELMLSMAFVAMLLVAIALLTIYISNLYTRGITLRQVNEAGSAISTDVSRTIQSASAFDPTVGSDSFVVQKDGGSVEPAGGRLCLGQYSYAWNYGKFINKHAAAVIGLPNYYIQEPDTTPIGPPIRLVKVVDTDKSLCKPNNPLLVALGQPASYDGINNDDKTTVELLSSGDRDLALHELRLNGSKDKQLYSVTLVIGTNDTAALDTTNTCLPPKDEKSNENYCAVNEFDIVARTGK